MRAMFFGDSFTYGHGLPDCILPTPTGEMLAPGNKPSLFSWPNLTASELGLPCYNFGIPGASNLEIHWCLRNSNIDPGDLVVVEWTYPDRDCLLEDPIVKIGPWAPADIIEPYYAVHSSKDLARKSMLAVEHSALLLEHVGAKWMFFSNDEQGIEGSIGRSLIDNFQRYVSDEAMDGIHPGPESHKTWSEVVVHHAKQKLHGQSWDYGLKD